MEHFLAEFQGIMEVSKLPWLQKKKNIKNEKNIFHR